LLSSTLEARLASLEAAIEIASYGQPDNERNFTVSNYHAYLDDRAPVSAVGSGTIEAAIEALGTSARRVATGLVRSMRELLKRDINRYSDHLLRDMGFERDWDGSILPRRGEDGSR
jgi:hypothetical protein